MVSNVRHAGIVVGDLKEAIKFYKGLGFEVVEDSKGIIPEQAMTYFYGHTRINHKGGVKYIKMKVGTSVIELYELKTDELLKSFNHIAFTVKSIKLAWKYFKNSKLNLSKEIVGLKNHKLFFACDPWNNMLEIVEPLK